MITIVGNRIHGSWVSGSHCSASASHDSLCDELFPCVGAFHTSEVPVSSSAIAYSLHVSYFRLSMNCVLKGSCVALIFLAKCLPAIAGRNGKWLMWFTALFCFSDLGGSVV